MKIWIKRILLSLGLLAIVGIPARPAKDLVAPTAVQPLLAVDEFCSWVGRMSRE